MKIELEVALPMKKNDKKPQRNRQRKIKTEHKILDQDQINILAKLKRQLQENEKIKGNENGKQKPEE